MRGSKGGGGGGIRLSRFGEGSVRECLASFAGAYLVRMGGKRRVVFETWRELGHGAECMSFVASASLASLEWEWAGLYVIRQHDVFGSG